MSSGKPSMQIECTLDGRRHRDPTCCSVRSLRYSNQHNAIAPDLKAIDRRVGGQSADKTRTLSERNDGHDDSGNRGAAGRRAFHIDEAPNASAFEVLSGGDGDHRIDRRLDGSEDDHLGCRRHTRSGNTWSGNGRRLRTDCAARNGCDGEGVGRRERHDERGDGQANGLHRVGCDRRREIANERTKHLSSFKVGAVTQ